MSSLCMCPNCELEYKTSGLCTECNTLRFRKRIEALETERLEQSDRLYELAHEWWKLMSENKRLRETPDELLHALATGCTLTKAYKDDSPVMVEAWKLVAKRQEQPPCPPATTDGEDGGGT